MNNDGYRQPQQGQYRENSYREASVGSSQSASSRSGRRTRSIRREPDLRDHQNQNRGFEPRQPDLRDRMNEQRDQNRPAGYSPVVPIPVARAMPYPAAMPIVPAVPDHRDAAIAELQAQLRMVLNTQA